MTFCQYLAVRMWPSGYAKSCCTILGMPVVPEVKYRRLVSVFSVGILSSFRGRFLHLRQEVPPSRCGSLRSAIRCFRVGDSGRAASTLSSTFASFTQTMAFTAAALLR